MAWRILDIPEISWMPLNATLFAIVSWFYKLYTYCSVSDCLWRCCRALSRGQLDLNYGGSGASYRLKTVDLISPKLLVTMMRKTALLLVLVCRLMCNNARSLSSLRFKSQVGPMGISTTGLRPQNCKPDFDPLKWSWSWSLAFGGQEQRHQ